MRKIKPGGYWKDFENVKKELKIIVKKKGYLPAYAQLEKINGGLVRGIEKYHGGMNKIREMMEYEPIRKPKYYYKNPRNVKKELEPIIKRLGRFPLSMELREKGLWDLCNGINKYHGGLNAIRQEMGFELAKKPNGYWRNLKNIKREVMPIIKKLGHFPTLKELQDSNLGDLKNGIKRYYGGIIKVRELMGHEPIIKPPNYWKDFRNVKKELECVINKLGHFPSSEELKERKMRGILNAIQNYYGGFSKIREKMGHEQTRRPYRYLQNFENLKKELEPLIKKLGHFPTQKELINNKKSGLINSFKYYGGSNNLRLKLGYPIIKRVYSREEIIKIYKKWFKKFNRPLRSRDWGENNGYPCYGTIIKYFGTWGNFLRGVDGKDTSKNHGLYKYKNYRKELCDKVLEIVGKKEHPQKLITTDFERARKELGRNCVGVLDYYKRKFRLEGTREPLDRLIEDLYGTKCLRTEEKKQDSLLIEQGLEAYLRYTEKCKTENKKPSLLLNFFFAYDPETLCLAERTPPLKKYVTRYYKEKKKLEEKVE